MDNRQERKTTMRAAPWQRVILVLMVVVGLIACAHKGYQCFEIQQEMKAAVESKQQLEAEKQRLETEKADLQKPEKIEKVARDELGLVKPGEVPYVR